MMTKNGGGSIEEECSWVANSGWKKEGWGSEIKDRSD